MDKIILFVDDEILVLHSYERVMQNSSHECLLAQNVNDALKLLETQRIDLIISDVRMRPINGLEFLHYVRSNFPNIPCILLSAHSEISDMVQLIAQGLCNRYLVKPWDNAQLLLTIDKTLALNELIQKNDLNYLNHPNFALPVLPSLWSKFIPLLTNVPSLSEVSSIIEDDPSTHYALLRVVNSLPYSIDSQMAKHILAHTGIDFIKFLLSNKSILQAPTNLQKEYQDSLITFDLHMQSRKILFKLITENWNDTPKNWPLLVNLYGFGRLVALLYDFDNYKSAMKSITINKSDPYETLSIKNRISIKDLTRFTFEIANIPENIIQTLLPEYYTSDQSFSSRIMAALCASDLLSWHFVEKTPDINLSSTLITLLGLQNNNLLEYGKIVSEHLSKSEINFSSFAEV